MLKQKPGKPNANVYLVDFQQLASGIKKDCTVLIQLLFDFGCSHLKKSPVRLLKQHKKAAAQRTAAFLFLNVGYLPVKI